MDLPLKNQTALVTGGNTGIGAAICKNLSAKGAAVFINYIDSEHEAEQLRDELISSGGKAYIIKADVSNEEDVSSMFKYVLSQSGRLDILVSNAGIQKDNSFTELSFQDWKKVMDVNLNGGFLCAKQAAKIFLDQDFDNSISRARGKIIFISSVHDVIPWGGHTNYAASKGGIDMLMKSVAQELAPEKIRVNSISPGAVKTSINKDEWDSREDREKLLELIPYRRIGEPEDIANVTSWLCSDEADYITGTTIYVDGGMTLYPAFSDNG